MVVFFQEYPMHKFLLGAALLFAAPALACPMADAAAYQDAAAKVQAAAGTKVSLSVDGLTCGSCSETVAKALSALPGVAAAAVDYQSGRAEIAYDASKVKVESLIAEIKKAGYAARLKQS